MEGGTIITLTGKEFMPVAEIGFDPPSLNALLENFACLEVIQ